MNRPPLCVVCKKPCDPRRDLNSDGTHAHDACLRLHLVYPETRKEKRRGHPPRTS